MRLWLPVVPLRLVEQCTHIHNKTVWGQVNVLIDSDGRNWQMGIVRGHIAQEEEHHGSGNPRGCRRRKPKFIIPHERRKRIPPRRTDHVNAVHLSKIPLRQMRAHNLQLPDLWSHKVGLKVIGG